MPRRSNVALKNFLTNCYTDVFTSGNLHLYSGTQPLTGDTPLSGQVLLAIIPLPEINPFTEPVNGQSTVYGNWYGTGQVAAGAGTTAGWFRLFSNDNLMWIDGTVSAVGGGGTMELANTSIAFQQNIAITTFNISAVVDI